jgi:hypothetical protein
MSTEIPAFSLDPLIKDVVSARAPMSNMAYSEAPKDVATVTKTGDRKTRPMTAIVPPMNDPTAAVARAGPA